MAVSSSPAMSVDPERLARSEVRDRLEAAFTFAVEDVRVRAMKS
jgi:hypothetical protein